MFKGFQQFLMRGNVVDLAVAVVLGGAFGAVVAALVKDLITPLIAALVYGWVRVLFVLSFHLDQRFLCRAHGWA